jgi:hypothetical protein
MWRKGRRDVKARLGRRAGRDLCTCRVMSLNILSCLIRLVGKTAANAATTGHDNIFVSRLYTTAEAATCESQQNAQNEKIVSTECVKSGKAQPFACTFVSQSRFAQGCCFGLMVVLVCMRRRKQ